MREKTMIFSSLIDKLRMALAFWLMELAVAALPAHSESGRIISAWVQYAMNEAANQLDAENVPSGAEQ